MDRLIVNVLDDAFFDEVSGSDLINPLILKKSDLEGLGVRD